MEYSYADIERKFRESIIKARVKLASGVTIEGFYFVLGMEVDSNDNVKILAQKYPLVTDAKWHYVNVLMSPTAKLPLFEPLYWNPSNGIYHGVEEGTLFVVTKRLRRTFCVGLNSHSYFVRRYTNGLLLNDPCGVVCVDPTKPRVFNNEGVYSEKIYRVNTSLFFGEKRIGLIQENNIYLADPDYLHFMPEGVKGQCLPNH